MYTEGFGEILTTILTTNPELSSVPSASAILDTSNYTFQAVTFGKDAEGFSHHAHTVHTTSAITESIATKNLVIFAGQSNMNGLASPSNYPNHANDVSSQYINYWDIEQNKFVSAIKPGENTTVLSNNTYGINNWGPEVRFARRLVNEEIPETYIFKFAVAGSFVADKTTLPNALSVEPYERNYNSWSPSGSSTGNNTTLWNKFEAHCNEIINTLGVGNIRNVTFLWNQGESEAYTGQNNDEVALQFSALTEYFLDNVSGIFTGVNSFNIVRVKIHENFASGSESNWVYYPTGLHSSFTQTQVSYLEFLRGLSYATGQYPEMGFANVSSTSAAGYYGENSYSSTPIVRAQQEALDTNKYGPLISMDDQSIDYFGLGQSPLTMVSSPVYDLGNYYIIENLEGVSAYYLSDTVDASNIHYAGEALSVMGDRLYDQWVSLANPSKSKNLYNNFIVVARNYTDDTTNFSGSYDISATHRNFSSTYNSVPGYPAPNHTRLEMKPTTVNTVSANSIQVHDLGHYLNGASKASPYELIWNVVGTFPPSGYQGWDFFVLSGDVTGDDVRDATEVFVFSGQLEGVFNADQVMDKDGYLTVSPLSGLDDNLSAIGSPTKGSAFSGGALVYSSTTYNVDNGTALLAVRIKDGDGVALALFGGLNHLGVWCLDIESMLADGLTPPYAWDHLDNLRRYKLVSKVSFWDNLMYHNDTGGTRGLSAFNNNFSYGGPTYTLKFKFT